MLWFLPGPLKAAIAFSIMLLNTIVCIVPFLIVAFLKLLVPIKKWYKIASAWLIGIAETWVQVNKLAIYLTQKIEWEVQGLDGLKYQGWYMVICNHQSWVDILILQKIFTRRIPFLKFFLKQELIWVPLLGAAWWALDFPFMKRYTKAFIAKHPELKGKDLERTKKSCEKFKRLPVSVMNFLEGTRFTEDKHRVQKSPYKNLLKPKAGGLAYVLSAMGGKIDTLLDVTIVYREQQHGFWDFLMGKVSKVTVVVTRREIPVEMLSGDYENDPEFRGHFQKWVDDLWQEKEQQVADIHAKIA